MPKVEKRPTKGLDDSALIEFHRAVDQYPVMDPVTLAALMDPYAPVPATALAVQPHRLEDAA